MKKEVLYVYLRNHPLFQQATEQLIHEATSLMKVKTVDCGECFSYGDGSFSKIYLLIKGKVKISELNEESNELIKDILTSPDMFGDLSMDGQWAIDEYAEALTANTVVCMIQSWELRKMIAEHSSMAVAYAGMMNRKLRKVEARHSDLVFCDARTRLIRFIRNWAITDGSKVGNKIVLENYLTHTDIANAIAASRQSVNVLFNELRDAGVLFYNRKRIELSDRILLN